MNWIPLDKDHLPEEGQECLVTVWQHDGYGRNKSKIFYGIDLARFTKKIGYLKVEGGYFNTYSDWDEGQGGGIVAWMPAPKPYKPK